MNQRKFGNTDLWVSEIGFGAWAIGGGAMVGHTAIGWGDADDAVSVKAIHTALDKGINFFDTADIYGLGHSETILGKTIGKLKELIIASKVGNVARDETFSFDYSKEHIIQACESSLKRLQRDAIDYYQLHTARILHLENGECIEAMQVLQQQGKIRYWGISLNTFEPEPEAQFFMNNHLGSGFQLVFNVLNQKALPLLKTAFEKEYGIIARMPLQFGLLTGKFDNGFSFSTNDHRQKRVTPDIVDTTNATLAPIWALCKKYDCSKTQLALSYILHYKAISTVITGIRTPEQVQTNTTGFVQLEDADIELIETFGRTTLVSLMEKIQLQG